MDVWCVGREEGQCDSFGRFNLGQMSCRESPKRIKSQVRERERERERGVRGEKESARFLYSIEAGEGAWTNSPPQTKNHIRFCFQLAREHPPRL